MENKPTLYIIQGFIGAGKTTFSLKLKEKTNSIHLNPDEWVSVFFDEKNYKSDWNNCFDTTVSKLWKMAKWHLKTGSNVIFDMGFWLKKDRNYAKDVANECNCNFVHYYLYVPDEILKERIIKTRPKNWAEIHLKNFEINKKRFEIPASDENPIIINNF